MDGLLTNNQVNLTNMLWVEQPVGTGFSIGKANATNEEDISSDFIKFFKNWQVRG
jgi:carboxypeptidase D